jgi:hypothetical protein
MEPNFKNDAMTKASKLNTPGEPLTVRTHKFAIILLFILLGLLLFGIYFWISTEKASVPAINPTRPTYETNREPESTTAAAEVGSLQVMSTSDELTTIEADLLSTDLTTLDKELTQIDQELGSLR